ncbi:MAG TPA: hypothetical protein VD905_04455, partial [Flavobacteriales bacterium]|nr:hypothetical protein [Flavobacteriales bacterium]
NTPVPEHLKNKYSLVLDSGTLEHVFDYKTAVKNCMEMVKPGGHFIGISPANNLMGHGFYQLSPELFYSVFSTTNGFNVIKMVIAASNEKGEIKNWYEVANPDVIKSRLHLVNNFPVYILFIAKKTAEVEIFKNIPFQSDYVTTWNVHEVVHNNAPANESGLKVAYRKYTPMFLKNLLYTLRKGLTKKTIETPDLGKIDPEHFKKMDI